MTSLSLTAPTIWFRIAKLLPHRAASDHGAFSEHGSHDDVRNRRAFINEMLDRNPDAFASDMDVYNMMSTFPGQF